MATNEFIVRKGLIVNGSGSTVLDIQGSQGQLFSVTDDLTGTLFSVNDISGIPILSVDSDDTVTMGTFGENTLVVTGSRVGIGTATPAYELDVRGSSADSRIYLDDGASGAEIYLRSNGSGEAGLYISSNSKITRAGGDLNIIANAIDMNLSTNNGSTNHLRIDTSGDVTVAQDLFVNDYARIDALRVGTTSTDPGDGNLYVEGSTTTTGPVTINQNADALILKKTSDSRNSIVFQNSSGTDLGEVSVHDTANNSRFYVYDNVLGGYHFYSNSNGGDFVIPNRNVGIGTTSPTTTLEVRKDSSDTTLTAITSTNDTISLLNETDLTNNYTSIGFVGNAAEITARIASVADASNGRGNLVFLTGDTTSGTPTERMRIDSSGRLFLGTATIAAANAAADDFVIKGEGTAVGLTISNSSDAGTGTIFFGDSTSSAAAGFRYNHNTGDMAISAEDNITITADRVGINETNPTARLHIVGQNTSGLIVENLDGIASPNPYVSIAANSYSSADGTFRWEDLRASQASPSFIWNVADSSGTVLGFDFQTGDTSRLAINQSGNVGIGTTSPDTLLHLSSASSPHLRIQDTTNNVKLSLYAQDANAFVGTNSTHNLNIGTANTAAININNSQNVTVNNDLFVNDYARIDALRVGTTSTDPGDGNLYVEGSATVLGDLSVSNAQPKLRLFETDTTNQNKEILVSAGALYVRNLNDDGSAGSNLFVIQNDGDVEIKGSNLYFDGTNTYLRSDNVFNFLTDGGSAQRGKFKSIQVSTSYSGTAPDNGILFETDTNLFRSAANTLRTNDSLVVDDTLGYHTFNSGFGGSGWRVDSNANAEFQNLTVRGTFSVYELLAQQVRATNGSLLVATSGKVDTASGTSSGTLTFDTGSSYGHGFLAGDILLAQRLDPSGTSLKRTFVRVDTRVNAGSLTYTKLDGDNAEAGQEFVRIGHTSNADRQGHIYLTADDSNAPYIGVRAGLSSSVQFTSGTGSIERTRLGRLDGITSSTFGSLSGYGFWAAGNAYLEGTINATAGKIADLTITSNKIHTGAGNHNNADTGFYIDNSSNFSLGNKLSWNGSNLSVEGSITITGGDLAGVSSDSISGSFTSTSASIATDVSASQASINNYETQVVLNSNGMELKDTNNLTLASYGVSTTIGPDANDKSRIFIDNNSVDLIVDSGGTDTTFASFGATTTVGNTAAEHISIDSDSVDIIQDANNKAVVSATGLAITQGGSNVASFGANTTITGGSITLNGASTNDQVLINNTGMTVKSGNVTRLTALDTGVIAYGDASDTYSQISSTGLNVVLDGTSVSSFGSSARVGIQTAEHVLIDSSGFTVKDNNTTLATFGTDITLGEVGSSKRNVFIDASSGVTIRNNTTALANFGTDITLGQVGTNLRNVFIDADSGVNIRNNTTVLAAFGDEMIVGLDAADKTALRVDSSGNLTIGTSGTTNFTAAANGNVTLTGDLTATNITATTAGNIAGWSIGANTLSSGNVNLSNATDQKGLYISAASGPNRLQVGEFGDPITPTSSPLTIASDTVTASTPLFATFGPASIGFDGTTSAANTATLNYNINTTIANGDTINISQPVSFQYLLSDGSIISTTTFATVTAELLYGSTVLASKSVQRGSVYPSSTVLDLQHNWTGSNLSSGALDIKISYSSQYNRTTDPGNLTEVYLTGVSGTKDTPLVNITNKQALFYQGPDNKFEWTTDGLEFKGGEVTLGSLNSQGITMLESGSIALDAGNISIFNGGIDVGGSNGHVFITENDFVDPEGYKLFIDSNDQEMILMNRALVGTISMIVDGGSGQPEFAIRRTTGNSEIFRIDNNGNVGIGTTNPSYKLHVDNDGNNVDTPALYVKNPNGEGNGSYNNGALIAEFVGDSDSIQLRNVAQGDYFLGNSQQGNGIFLYDGTGGVQIPYSGTNKFGVGEFGGVLGVKVIGEALGVNVNPSSTAGRIDASNDIVAFSTSDKRLKDNITPLTHALAKIDKISGIEFDWKPLTEEEKETVHGFEGHDVGVIAQEVEEVLPEVVTERENGYKAVKYEKIVPLLIEGIKELKSENNILRKELENIKKMLNI